MGSMDVDARNAETALAIATGVATSPKPQSSPGGIPANKLWRRIQLDGIAETRSSSDPGARAAIGLPNAECAIPQEQQIAVPGVGDLCIVVVQLELQVA